MNINPLTATVTAHAANSGGSGSSDATNPLQDTNDMFVKLLTTQLKNQTPLDPMDPNQFTTELVQFNMLDQLSQIRQLLQQDTTAPPNSTSQTNSIQGAH